MARTHDDAITLDPSSCTVRDVEGINYVCALFTNKHVLGLVEASVLSRGSRAAYGKPCDRSTKTAQATSPQAVTLATVATSHPTRHDPLLLTEADSFKLPALSLPTQRSVFDQLMQRPNVCPVGNTQSHI